MDTFNVSGMAAQPRKTRTPRASVSASDIRGVPDHQGQSAHRLLYDRREAARQLSISIRSLDYLIAAGEFETRRIGKKVLITHRSLVRFAQGNHYESPKELATVAA
jgi:hypothetical protein